MDSCQKRQIEALYLEMFDKMMIYARVNLDSESLAEEAVQETFRIACQNPEKLCGSQNPQGWLVRTLKNTISNMKRDWAVSARIVEQYMMAQLKDVAVTEDRVHLDILYSNVADSEEFKLLTEMVFLGRSHEEMAKARDITVSACKKRVQRAKETLRKRIGK